MSRRLSARTPVFAMYAEHPHDGRAIRELINGLRPEVNALTRMQILRRPPTLVKSLQEAKRRTRASKVIATLRAVNRTDGLAGVLFHEDADSLEPAHNDVEATYRATYAAAPCEIVVAAPAWELETWWFLFPDAVAAVCAAWVAPRKFSGKDVGRVRQSKEELARCVRPGGRRPGSFREYREEDGERIARNAVRMGLLDKPDASSASWKRFVDQIVTFRLPR